MYSKTQIQSPFYLVQRDSDFYGKPQKLDFGIRRSDSGTLRTEERTGIPDRYCNADFPSFDFGVYCRDMSRFKNICNDFFCRFPEWELSGKGIFLWSKTPGSGKTLLACSLARSIAVKHDVQMRFTTATRYLDFVGDKYKRDYGAEDPSRIYRTCRLLVLDDLGAQKAGQWQEQELFELINQRYESGLLTVYTSNMEPEDLNVNDRLVSRITDGTLSLHLPEVAVRKQKEIERQEKFLESRGL